MLKPIEDHPPRRTSPAEGFSLVELAVALGILAFAVLAIYGLLPVGLQISRQARGDLRGVEIMARVTEDFRIWEKMTNGLPQTPFYGFSTGYDAAEHRFTTARQSQLVVYEDGSTNNTAGERFTVTALCEPVASGRSSRVGISVVRGQGAQVSFSSTGAVHSKEEGVAYTSIVLTPPAP